MLIIQYVRTMLRNEKGQGMVEYGLIIAVIAVAVMVGMGTFAGELNTFFVGLGGKLKIN